MSEPLRRVERLIALAVSTKSDEEARTAAMLAVRMIRQYNLRISDPPTARRVGMPLVDVFDQDFRSLFRREAEAEAAEPSTVAPDAPQPSAFDDF